MASFSSCLHCTSLSFHPFKGDSSSPSLPSSHPLTRTSTAFLCPPQLNSTLMIWYFLPLPCMVVLRPLEPAGRVEVLAWLTEQVETWQCCCCTQQQVPIISCGHSDCTAPCSSGNYLFAGRKAGPVAEMCLFGLTCASISRISFQFVGTCTRRIFLFETI